MIRIGILGSTRGTNLDAIVDAISQKKINAEITIVASNKTHAAILTRAADQDLKTIFLDPANLSREEFDAKMTEVLRQHEVDLVVLIGFMRILSAQFIHDWQGRIINVHPSLLPLHAGKMDLDVHRAVISAGEKESGCSVHVVTEEVDAGPILVQKKCVVLAADTPEQLKERVQQLEGAALVQAIASFSCSF